MTLRAGLVRLQATGLRCRAVARWLRDYRRPPPTLLTADMHAEDSRRDCAIRYELASQLEAAARFDRAFVSLPRELAAWLAHEVDAEVAAARLLARPLPPAEVQALGREAMLATSKRRGRAARPVSKPARAFNDRTWRWRIAWRQTLEAWVQVQRAAGRTLATMPPMPEAPRSMRTRKRTPLQKSRN